MDGPPPRNIWAGQIVLSGLEQTEKAKKLERDGKGEVNLRRVRGRSGG